MSPRLAHVIIAVQAFLNVVLLFSLLIIARITPADVLKRVQIMETDNKTNFTSIERRLGNLEQQVSEVVVITKSDKIYQGMRDAK